MFGIFGDLADLINDRVRQITREKDKELLRALGIKEEPEEVIVMASRPDECIVSFIRAKDWSVIKTFSRHEVDEVANKIARDVIGEANIGGECRSLGGK